ncbi:MAG: exodeoxyribonuclease VII small subunit [Burkholderiaceae bacterium]|nr:exodeoxyribonuclease VII small subunit [Burkholderiaceae bacterium]
MDSSNPESFERALAELEQLVQRMESGTLSLEESLGAYRRGASLVAWCRRSLADVQQQVRILEADLLEPFDAAAGACDPGEPGAGSASR